MKIKRHNLSLNEFVFFNYENGDRYVYITEGKHSLLQFGVPVELKVGESISITAEEDCTVSCMYVE